MNSPHCGLFLLTLSIELQFTNIDQGYRNDIFFKAEDSMMYLIIKGLNLNKPRKCLI
jgi:hypothetical protein